MRIRLMEWPKRAVEAGRQIRRFEDPMLSSPPSRERSHSGLVRRFAKPLKGSSSSEGSNPSLSASRVPVAQRIERQVADLKVGGSSPLGHAIAPSTGGLTFDADRAARPGG